MNHSKPHQYLISLHKWHWLEACAQTIVLAQHIHCLCYHSLLHSLHNIEHGSLYANLQQSKDFTCLGLVSISHVFSIVQFDAQTGYIVLMYMYSSSLGNNENNVIRRLWWAPLIWILNTHYSHRVCSYGNCFLRHRSTGSRWTGFLFPWRLPRNHSMY